MARDGKLEKSTKSKLHAVGDLAAVLVVEINGIDSLVT